MPNALGRCGYKTFSLYPFYGAFLGSRGFQTSAGIERYLDMKDLGTRGLERDSFYYDQATNIIAREHRNGPLFLFVYTAANHFPWDFTFRPELTPDWRTLGNAPNIDEYIRRQTLSAKDYSALLARLKQDFPTDFSWSFASEIISRNLPIASSIRRSASLRLRDNWKPLIRATTRATTQSTP